GLWASRIAFPIADAPTARCSCIMVPYSATLSRFFGGAGFRAGALACAVFFGAGFRWVADLPVARATTGVLIIFRLPPDAISAPFVSCRTRGSPGAPDPSPPPAPGVWSGGLPHRSTAAHQQERLGQAPG